jgi:IS5 family transposase
VSYRKLAFDLIDSKSCKAFVRLGKNIEQPTHSTLQANISCIQDVTWERINKVLLRDAATQKLERGRRIRIDTTVTETNIHHPTDSSLLFDSVRVMVRLLEKGSALAEGVEAPFPNHLRAAKRRARCIGSTKGKDKKRRLYRELLRYTQKTLGYLQQAVQRLCAVLQGFSAFTTWRSQVSHYTGLIRKVMEQTRRRVLDRESVPARHKVVSLFEPHTDIIVKDNRETYFGHKIALTTTPSGLIADLIIERGNPADSSLFPALVDRQIELYGRPPRQAAADGGFASVENLKRAKQKGIKDVMFHKKTGLEVEQMTRSQYVYRMLRNFRAGIEGNISCMKRSHGMSRCLWKGWDRFKAYLWSSAVAHNLCLIARLGLPGA